jgi:hypothetical protein
MPPFTGSRKEVIKMFRQIKLFTALFLLAALALLIQAAPVAAAGIAVSPSSGSNGTTFTLVGDGFNPGERVSVAVIAPNNSVVNSGMLTADRQGHIQFSAQIPKGAPAGHYTIIAQGQSSHRQFSAGFTVTGAAGTGGTTPSLAPPGMVISPTSGGYGTTFVVTAGGFNPWEPVSVWVTTPSGSTIGPQTITANASGAIQASGTVANGSQGGIYTAYAQGQFSGHRYSGTFTLVVPTYPDWKGEYFNNMNLSGSPVLVRDDKAINFNWGTGSPDPSVQADHFSVRWTRNQFFNAGTYTFTATTDDGMRVWVGGTLLIDAWYDQSSTHTASITLSEGTYPLRVEYYEDTGFAVAQVSWSTASSSSLQPWTGSYYNNMTLSGTPAFVRQDSVLDFNWGGGSPGPGVGGTDWSAKWDSTQFAPTAGNYTVAVIADDGVRVWVDGNLVIDQWHDQSPTFYSSTGYLNAGWHTIHVEYYQHNGGSVLQLGFSLP